MGARSCPDRPTLPRMAYIQERTGKHGTTYQVRWRDGGVRGAPGQTEKFDDRSSAETFKQLVDLHGQHWPPGWIRGKGFVQPEEAGPEDVPLVGWAHRVVDKLTGIEDRTRHDYHRDVDRHLALVQHTTRAGTVHQATVTNITRDDIADWVRAQEIGQRDPADPEQWERKPADPKSIANRHGLLFSIFQAALEADPPLRTANPCAKTRLPRVDHGTDDDMTFLERDEYQRIRAELRDDQSRDIADILVGTGLRWGELAGLQVRDLQLGSATPTLRVARAFKRAPGGALFLGPPKTRKSRRTIALSPAQVDILRRQTVGAHGPEAHVFRTAWGNPWANSSHWRERRWKPAVRAAQAGGLGKAPRVHDLRHTHVAWLVAGRIPLPAIQARLGHESIKTTIDRYGHLVREMDAEMVAAVDAAMALPTGEGLRLLRSQAE